MAFSYLASNSSSVFAEDWMRWRGPSGNGICNETSAVEEWSPSKNIAWKSPVPGIGHSSPIVVGSKVLLTTGTEQDEARRVLCFDRNSGELLWNQVVHQGPAGKMHQLNSTASSTPCSDGKQVYAVFVDDVSMTVCALDLDGKILWKREPGSYFSNHGFAASPILFDEGVIITGHQDGDAFVVMLDRTTGDEIWRYKPAVNIRSFSTPLIIEQEGKPMMILTGGTQTVGIDPATGKLLWSAEGPSQKFVSSPSVGHNMVFSFGGSPEKIAMAVRLGGQGDVTSSHIVWRTERSMPYIPSPILVGNFLHILADNGVYTCMNPLSGEVLLTGRKARDVNSSPVAVGEKIYFFEDSGKCTIIRNGASFEIVAENELGERVLTTPAVSNGELFVRTESSLVCIKQK